LLGIALPAEGLSIRETSTNRWGDLSGERVYVPEYPLDLSEIVDDPRAVAEPLARVWFREADATAPWLREGFAMWVSSVALGLACPDAPLGSTDSAVDLGSYGFDFHGFSDEYWAKASLHSAAACRVVELGAEAIGEDSMLAIITGRLASGEQFGTSDWLDAIDAHADADAEKPSRLLRTTMAGYGL
jgi:hypothetical protein